MCRYIENTLERNKDMNELNLANSIFPGFNDQNGLMICGYEWGWSKADEAAYEQGEYTLPEEKVEHTFANKALYYGERAKTWRYDNAIKTWFDLCEEWLTPYIDRPENMYGECSKGVPAPHEDSPFNK